jgi:lichenan operon transcriptional antiterminator
MFNYKRLDDIFNYIRNNEFTTASKLSLLLKVSERTIRTDINNLNDNLIGASIKLKRRSGYYVEIHDLDAYNKFIASFKESSSKDKELDSSQDRVKYILSILLYSHDYISIDDLADSVFVAKNTLSNYIKTIKKILPVYNLEYIVKPGIGIKIIGNESNKRECIINEIYSQDHLAMTLFSTSEKTFFNDIDLHNIGHIIINIFNKYKIETEVTPSTS